VFLTENSAQSPVMFRIAPADLLRGYEQAEGAGLEVVGIFHSHPAPPWPSRVDLEYMRVNPVIWLIMSMPSGEQRAFHLRKTGIAPVDIEQA
jgi:proteasome lid subunit RPN8/RPN11